MCPVQYTAGLIPSDSFLPVQWEFSRVTGLTQMILKQLTFIYRTYGEGTACMWRSVDYLQKLALFSVWVPGIELRSSCLVASVLNHWAILPATQAILSRNLELKSVSAWVVEEQVQNCLWHWKLKEDWKWSILTAGLSLCSPLPLLAAPALCSQPLFCLLASPWVLTSFQLMGYKTLP